MIRKIFRKISGKPFESFEEIDRMVTRDLPIPDHEGAPCSFRFVATRRGDGNWRILSEHNAEFVSDGFRRIVEAYQSAERRHLMENGHEKKPMTFDAAFLILRDLEEALLLYDGRKKTLSKEPNNHFMLAWRLAPPPLREGLDELYAMRSAQELVLKPKADQTKTPARKPD